MLPFFLLLSLTHFFKEMTNQKENYSVDFIIDFIRKKKKILSIVFFISILFSIGIAYIITPLYEGTAVFFPTQLGGVSKSLLSQNGDKEDFLQLGDEEVVEQFLQILSSDLIREKIVEKYKLFEHYGIDKKGKYPYTKLNKKYNDNITFSKTRYQSIQVDVLDPNPEYAANIANDIVSYLDSVINEMQHRRAFLAYKEVEKKYLGLQQEIAGYQDSLVNIGKKGIVDYESQSKSLTEAYANALLSGNNTALSILKKQIDTLAKYGPVYNSLTNYLIFQREQLSVLRSKFIEAQVNAELKLPHKYIVRQAQTPEKKAYPIRWLVVVIITLSAQVLALFILLLLEKKNAILD